MKYDPHLIEKKWQIFWKQNKSFKATEDSFKPKYYVLDMFPYPSGAGLHVGHLIGYTATDILARYKLANGFSVLHPMGWDSFGLPAEQYAIRTGTHPSLTTQTNIENYKVQLNSIGYAYDWDREIMTSEPKYYKWTQWIFTKLYERGLAYQADILVNWCPALGTVLANEEIEEGFSKEGGHPIERRPLKQWVLKITEYADRLLEDLDDLNWPDGLKRLQINWIGRSEGAEVDFAIEGQSEALSVFTTCPHTLFGVTFMVVSPEHPLVELFTSAECREEVIQYQKATAQKSDLERAELSKVKTGVFTGGYAINPVNKKKIPIWIADYVLMGYGTGAIMAVPGHDERDQEFAHQFNLPIETVLDERGVCCNSESEHLSLNGLSSKESIKKSIHWLEEKGAGKATINYKLRDWLFSRQRYWGEPFPIVHLQDGTTRALRLDELPLEPPQVNEYKPSATGESPLAKVRDWVEVIDPITGEKALRETNTMPQWAGSCWYYLRFCDPLNENAAWSAETEKYWMPVDLYVGGAEHAVLHLLYARFWHKVLYDCGLVGTSEPFKRLLNQGLIVARAYQKQSGQYVSPDQVVEKDGKYFHWESHEELRSQVEKMSKSKLNGVSPDEIIEEFGADALRLYSMFMGPIDREKVWSTDNIQGCRRFLNRFYEMATSEKLSTEPSEDAFCLAHKLVKGVTEDIEKLLFNTAIAKMMEFVNDFTKLDKYPKEAVKMAVQALAPFAPHMAEELWVFLGEQSSVSHASWPKALEKYLIEESVTYVVQVNGKVRARYTLPKGLSQEELVEKAHADTQLSKYLVGEIKKVIFVPNKLLNLVVV
ncbi:MAG: Leucine--tRNA ligase [Chlamydiales bacterium]|nr:Leucine--tRNA ligase [Chlamydiales bacterium]